MSENREPGGMSFDPDRGIDDDSGWVNCGVGSVPDYFAFSLRPENRETVFQRAFVGRKPPIEKSNGLKTSGMVRIEDSLA